MSNKTKIIISIVALLTAFATGRFTVPTKTVTETKYVEVEKKEEKKNIEKEVHKKTTVVESPDGKKVTTITEDSGTNTQTTTKDNTSISDDKSKTVTRDSLVTISFLGGLALTGVTPVYGASVTKPILGPITLGAWGLSNQTIGASIGLSF